MKILVTGGAGFIGSNFILYIMGKYPDYEIVNLDKLTYAGNLDNLKSVEDDSRYKFICGDIGDREAVKKAMSGCDWVVHFAAESHVDRSIANPEEFVRTNVLGTEILLETARDLGVKRFHHVSTDEVFGTLPLDKPEEKFSEKTPYSPRSPYSASKAGSDHLVRAFIETYSLPATISNCTNNYGPFHFPEKAIPLFIINAFENKPLPIYGSGLAVRDYLYVTDHCVAIDLILHRGKIGETYCVGGDSERNGIQIADAILDVLGKPHSLKAFVADRKGHDMRYAMDHSKITNNLGWTPSVTFDEGIVKTVEWYKSNETWWKKITAKKYIDDNRAVANNASK
jgi:dTDP-glucose 4,6-dehydratase